MLVHIGNFDELARIEEVASEMSFLGCALPEPGWRRPIPT